ncbi:ABC transporter permease [Devosia sp. SL43]|uniref:ABC transporter permease n=1 Tax=Devosia sp. SL43 TaxID=2806348 RepID=UPI001F1F91B8|nr:ABC transporter permease [Devosia sp. SL43]UJW87295.1 ABC transporter permease [Devosia sp. SL43]
MLLDFHKLGSWKWLLLGICLLTALFLLLPIVFIVALSFGNSRWLIFPPPGWTLQWYQELLSDPRWLEAAFTSARIGVVVTIISVVLGFLASLALVRGTFPGRSILRAFFLTPMVLPVAIIGVALYAAFLRVGLSGTFIGFVIAHVIVALPFAIITISGALETFDPAIEDAAVLCGASPWEARFRVTMPAISHGLFSAAIFSFLISWDEVVLSIFMASPTLQTLPVRVWSTLRQDLTPVVAAASALFVVLTLLLMAAAALIRKGKSR